MPLTRKSILFLLLAMLMVFGESCSKKIPCPETAKVAKQAKVKKKKAPKKKASDLDEDGTENAEASAAVGDDGSGEPTRPKITGTKNKYNKNGLLQKSKYKRLRSNPARKRNRAKKGLFSGLFSGKKKSGTKKRAKRSSVDTLDE